MQSHLSKNIDSVIKFIDNWPEPMVVFDRNLTYLCNSQSVNLNRDEIVSFLGSNEAFRIDIIQQLKDMASFSIFVPVLTREYIFHFSLWMSEYICLRVDSVEFLESVYSQKEKIKLLDVNLDRFKDVAEIAAGLSHEINNPLTVILARNQFIKNEVEKIDFPMKQKCLESIEKINSYSERISKIIKALRSFSKESPAEVVDTSDLGQIVDDVQYLVTEQMRKKSIQFIIEKPKEPLLIECRVSEVMQIIIDLIKNAIDASSQTQDPWIELKIQKIDRRIKLTVKDNGPGVAPEDKDKIFRSFYTTKPSGIGLGLGLTISKYLAEKNKASLYFDEKDSLSSFSLEFC